MITPGFVVSKLFVQYIVSGANQNPGRQENPDMHEMGIVYHVADEVEKNAAQNDIRHIGSVPLQIGEVTGVIFDYIHLVCERIEERFEPGDVDKFEEMLGIISEELMPEAGRQLRERD